MVGLMSNEVWNIGLYVADLLTDQHGFEQLEEPSHFRKVVDSQHAAFVSISPWDRKPPGGYDSPSVRFGVARRDINELWAKLINDRVEPWRSTVSFSYSETERVGSFLYFEHSQDDVEGFVDEWMPKMVAEHTNLASVERRLGEVRRSGRMDTTFIPRMMNALLDGWTEADSVEFLGELSNRIENLSDQDDRERIHRQIERVKAWVAEHPDGVERELTGR